MPNFRELLSARRDGEMSLVSSQQAVYQSAGSNFGVAVDTNAGSSQTLTV